MRLPLDEQEKVRVRESRWQSGRGENEDTKRWVAATVKACKDKDGAKYRAFGRDELRSEQATVKLSSAQVAAGYEKVLQTAFLGLKLVPVTFLLQDKFKLKDGGLLCKLMLDLSLTEAIKARDGRVSVGPTGYLCFRFKKLNLEGARGSSEGSPAKAPKNTEVTTGNNPDTGIQAQAEVNEVQME